MKLSRWRRVDEEAYPRRAELPEVGLQLTIRGGAGVYQIEISAYTSVGDRVLRAELFKGDNPEKRAAAFLAEYCADIKKIIDEPKRDKKKRKPAK